MSDAAEVRLEAETAIKQEFEPLEILRGSGNVHRDLSQDDADVKQFKALLRPKSSSPPTWTA